jgi:hypothetical protein
MLWCLMRQRTGHAATLYDDNFPTAAHDDLDVFFFFFPLLKDKL